MGDVGLAEDIIAGVSAAMEEVGSTHILKLATYAVDPAHPGGGPVETIVAEVPVQAFLYGNDQFYIKGTSVVDDSVNAAISIEGLTNDHIDLIQPGNAFLTELTPIEKIHNVLSSSIGVVAGIFTTALVRLT